MVRVNPAQFVRHVRRELAQVVWPTKKETGIGTLMVFIMTALMAVFFLLADQIISWVIQLIVG